MIGERGAALVEQLTARTEDADARMGAQTEKFVASVDERINAIDQVVNERGGELVERISTQVDNFASRIGDNSRHFAEEIEARLAALDEAVSTRGGKLVGDLSERSAEFVSGLDQRAQELYQNLDAKLDAIDMTLNAHGGVFFEKLSEQVDQFASRIGDNSRHFADEIDTRLNSIDEAISVRGGKLVSQLDATTVSVFARLSDEVGKLAGEVSSKLEAIDHTIIEKGEELVGKLESRAIDIASTMSNKIEAFENVTDASTTETTERIDELVGSVDTGLGVGGQMLQESLASHALEVARVIGEGGREVMQTLDAKLGTSTAVLLSRSSGTRGYDRLQNGGDQRSARRITPRSSPTTLDGRIELFEKNVSIVSATVSSEIDERGRSVVDTIGARVCRTSTRRWPTRVANSTRRCMRAAGDLGQTLDRTRRADQRRAR